jgi:uncharacterized protein DUF3592
MKKFGKFAWISLGIGALMLFIALVLWNKTRSFVARAASAQGVVTELIVVRDKDGGSDTYKPAVQFTTPEGQEVNFTSSFSSRPPAYDVGEAVPVLYIPGHAEEARLKGFGSLWLGPTILAGLGAVFGLIGGSILYAGRMGEKKRDYLMAYGNSIQTDYQGVDRNTSLKVNGRSPWRITSQYLDPTTNKLRIFHSENLWFDPTNFIKTRQLTVLVDPKDPKRYHMDTSFLPETDDE